MTGTVPKEGTKTRDVLEEIEPTWQTGHEIARRVEWATAPDSCYSFLGDLRRRGLVDVDHSGPGLAGYRLTDAGRAALERGDTTEKPD